MSSLKIPMTNLVQCTPQTIERAATLLRTGGIVAFPTETVYGLGVDATNEKAVLSLFQAKNRPLLNPFIIHLADIKDIVHIAEMNTSAETLGEAFWPGPLTLVLWQKQQNQLSPLACAHHKTVAVRVPDHPIAYALLTKTKRPIAAASANISGTVSPTTPFHVSSSLKENVDLILADKKCRLGLESTIIDVTENPPVILRSGMILQDDIESLIGKVVVPSRRIAKPKAPGLLDAHYAPCVPMRLNIRSVVAGEALLAFGPDMFMRGGVMRLNLSRTGNLHEAAQNLYAMLHELDKPEHTAIAVMPIPQEGLGIVINERLNRASRTKPPR